jgi:hypothetical protein
VGGRKWAGGGVGGLEEKVGRRGREKENRGRASWAGPRGEGERFREVFSFFQTFSNSFFKLLKMNSSSNS